MNIISVANNSGKIGVAVELYKIDAKEFRVFDQSINNGMQLVQYGKYRWYYLYECMYWYAIKVHNEYYAFKISDIIAMIGFDGEQKDKDRWLLSFIECLEASQYYIDFENSIRQHLKPIDCTLNATVFNKKRFTYLFFPIVKLIKRFHLSKTI